MLPCCEVHPNLLDDNELAALMLYWRMQGWPTWDSWQNAVCRWAKLQLSNGHGQRAQSIWFELSLTTSVRHASCVDEVSNSIQVDIDTPLLSAI